MTKAILKDEILSDAELDNVAGGTFAESYSDANNFEKLGVKIFEKDIAGVPILDHEGFVNLRAAFDKYGVKIKDDGSIWGDLTGKSKPNQYFIGGKEVTQAEAWKHINAQFGK
ncbi:MAG: hypothetical protein IJL12_02965 [Selenomonadaceae bacterium]|nr:hypothetical protein [Selenomonadaceae bacterium]MBQ6131285.1 hypothetical protein [Selenomonadaceae bacterium]